MYGECTPEQKQECPLARHYTDEHHKYYPRRDYHMPVEKAFRNLPENIEPECRYEHQKIHDEQEPPEKPSLQYMAEAVVRSEVHMNRRVASQVADVIHRQQELITNYWQRAEQRRA